VALTPGTKIGSYEITAQIGVGGMGEVYRATDTRLKRDVAIKVLPEALAADAERLARFQREAEVLASLNHPGIAHIYGIEESSAAPGQTGSKALVMELVEGPTLADRIVRGPVPVDEALSIAKQIAEALEAAHEQGIIHRDLKPANIKLRPDGTVKVLDFGLAKAMEPAGAASSSLSMSPTITTPAMTQAGLILGTAAYMSPEQAKGRPADRRSDVWAFGAVLFEMLAGRRAFEAEDVSETLAAVLMREPDWSWLPATTPAAVVAVLQRCLQKSPKQRMRDIGDVALALDGAFETRVESVPQAAMDATPAWRRLITPVASAAVVAGLLLGIGWATWPSASLPVIRSEYRLPDGVALGGLIRSAVKVAPDGTFVVYSTATSFRIRMRDSLDEREIRATEVFVADFSLSPDGQSVAFWEIGQDPLTGQLRRMPLAGGSSVLLASIGIPFGVSWEEDGSILYGQQDGIWRLFENGGEPERIITVGENEWVHGPRLLPGGEWVLFTLAEGNAASRWNEAKIVVQSLATGERREVIARGRDARYLPTGQLVFGSDGALFAVPFDIDRLTVTGGRVPVVEGVVMGGSLSLNGQEVSSGVAQYDVAPDGTLVYLPGTTAAGGAAYQLALVDEAGTVTVLPAPQRDYAAPRVSPDGTQIAVEVTEAGASGDATHVFVVSRDSGVLRQLTFDGTRNRWPIWTADGSTVVFESNQGDDNGWGIYRKAASGSGPADLIVEHTRPLVPLDASKEGVLLFARSVEAETGEAYGLWTVPLDGSAAPTVFLENIGAQPQARLSPDGRWVAYVTDESGRPEVYVRPYPRVDDTRWRVSESGGIQPLWAPDQKAIYFGGQGTAEGAPEWRAAVETGPTLTRGPVERLFGWVPAPERIGDRKELMPDGQHFLIAAGASSAGQLAGGAEQQSRIVTVYNWFEELKRLVPTE